MDPHHHSPPPLAFLFIASAALLLPLPYINYRWPPKQMSKSPPPLSPATNPPRKKLHVVDGRYILE